MTENMSENNKQLLFVLNYTYASGEKFFGVFDTKDKARDAQKEMGVFDSTIYEVTINECLMVLPEKNKLFYGKAYEE